MRSLVAALLLAAVTAPAVAQQDTTVSAIERATVAARLWLTLVDQLDYADSWTEAHETFRTAISQEGWVRQMRRVRSPLGDAGARDVISARYTTDLPNAPPGEYVLIQFRTDFAQLADAVETVVPMRAADGTWRVSGYFIRPPR